MDEFRSNNEVLRQQAEVLKDLVRKINDMNVLLAVYNSQLKDHMRRSDSLEKIVEKVENRSYKLTVQLYLLVGMLTVIQAVLFIILSGG